jgi:hypothetical protein
MSISWKDGRAVNWDDIKNTYICGVLEGMEVKFLTNVELGEMYGIAASTVGKRASKEGWATERKLYLENLALRKREKRSEQLAEEAANMDARILQCVKAGLTHLEKHFTIGKTNYYNTKQPLSLTSLENLAKSLEKYQKIGRLTLGESVSNVNVKGGDTWLDLFEVGDS